MALLKDDRVFPDYEYREFPKWVKLPGSDEAVLVADAEAESKLFGNGEETEEVEVEEKAHTKRRRN